MSWNVPEKPCGWCLRPEADERYNLCPACLEGADARGELDAEPPGWWQDMPSERACMRCDLGLPNGRCSCG
jgi:hypothetical protein